MIQVNFTDKNGESCWADFSSAQAAVEYCGIENILSWEHYDEDGNYIWSEEAIEWEEGFHPDNLYEDEYDGQPDEYTEWQDYMGGDDWDHGQYDETF
jgi:hypothetical protein